MRAAGIWGLFGVVLWGALLLAPACVTEAQAINITGASMTAIGETFAIVGPAMKTACEGKTIAATDCARWKIFGQKFQQAYPIACDLWRAADMNQDAKLEAQVSVMLGGFGADLDQFSALVGVK